MNVVHFAPGSPGIVQLKIALDGRPVETAWTNAVDKLFAFLDRSGDGKLDEKERAALAPQTGRRRADAPALLDSELAGRLRFEKNADAVDRAAFAEALKAAGFGPVAVPFLAAREDSAALTNALFRHLDANGDGKLGTDELAAARDRLAFLDVNEDEWLTSQELTARAVTANRQQVLTAPGRRPLEPAETNSNDLLLLNGTGLAAVKQILAAKGKPKATSLTREQLGLDAKSHAESDRDSNGQLDTDELLEWLRRPPVLSVSLELSTKPGKSSAKPAGVTMSGSTRFEVTAPDSLGMAEANALADQLRAAFKAIAKDGKLEKAKLKDQQQLAAGFAMLDRNADDTLEQKELDAALDVLAALATCRATVSFVDQGRGLFELVDANRDGRLSPRELASLPGIAKEFAGKDGLAKTDVPRLLAIRTASTGLRMMAQADANDRVVFSEAMFSPSGPPATPANVPVWFARMDLNGDGDVSLKEFLGPLERFRMLDADADGLISVSEAKK